MDGNFNVFQGNHRYLDRSKNVDSFNVLETDSYCQWTIIALHRNYYLSR